MAAAASELNGVRQKIPHDLLQTISITGNQSDARFKQRFELYALRLSGGPDAFNSRLDDWLHVAWAKV